MGECSRYTTVVVDLPLNILRLHQVYLYRAPNYFEVNILKTHLIYCLGHLLLFNLYIPFLTSSSENDEFNKVSSSG